MKKIQYLYRINMHVYRTVFGTSRCIQRYLDGIRRIYHAPQQPGKMMILEGKDVFGKDQTPSNYLRYKARRIWGEEGGSSTIHAYVYNNIPSKDDIKRLDVDLDSKINWNFLVNMKDVDKIPGSSPPNHQ